MTRPLTQASRASASEAVHRGKKTASSVDSVDLVTSSPPGVGSAPARSALRETLHFALLASGLYASFLTWGLLQERIASTTYLAIDGSTARFQHFSLLSAFQALFSAILARVSLALLHKDRPFPIWRRGAASLQFLMGLVGLTAASSSPLAYASLAYLNYPTLMLGKTAKLIPVMLVRWVVYGQRADARKVFASLAITAGVFAFSMLGESSGPSKYDGQTTTGAGLALLALSLLLDGLTNATEDRMFQLFGKGGSARWRLARGPAAGAADPTSPDQVSAEALAAAPTFTAPQLMLYLNLAHFCLPLAGFGAAVLLTRTLSLPGPVVGLLTPLMETYSHGLAFLRTHPAALVDVCLFAFCGAVGQLFVFAILAKFGSITLVTLTVTRKLASIVASVFLFRHPVTGPQWAAIALVAAGLLIEAAEGIRKAGRKSQHPATPAGGAVTKQKAH
ncbi:hypothetical protein H696_03889 [Fonticula alba]|uniref:Sugar phosphate transporter domain-containing protein n=1 Tax=Fonticula alba TaxID=691883 RepID=A0A058Z5F5_FONAL|nr:hypothetical protein H696_03889 [Fonticula alba]KCV69460.1 hypothetical protein H696_03889 [Fonticula alba]|eukprot:XP_009496025.1 hypothetical protein H696_03889 [Fonticula alba]